MKSRRRKRRELSENVTWTCGSMSRGDAHRYAPMRASIPQVGRNAYSNARQKFLPDMCETEQSAMARMRIVALTTTGAEIPRCRAQGMRGN
jgi:hypothetical protein